MDVLSKLKEEICRINVTIDEDEIPLDEGLMGAGIIDSFGFVEFVTFLENEFEIEFEDGELDEENFKNIIEISRFIENKIAEKQ